MSRRFGNYTVHRKLGEGGMGAVYLVTAPDGARCALKTLRGELASNAEFSRRFVRETGIAAQMTHPHIVRTIEHGQAPDGTLFLVTEFCARGGLDAWLIKRGAIGYAEAIFWMAGIARALDYAWQEHHVIHRDIKPANLLLDADWNIKLSDMGLARRADADATRLTMEGTVVGSVSYMSPEQALSAHDLDVRSDMYSLGATFYHLVSGEPVFSGSTVAHIIKKHVQEPPEPLTAHVPDAPAAFAALIHMLLQKDPDRRPESAAELLERLTAMAAQLAIPLDKFPGPESEPNTAEIPATDDAMPGRGSNSARDPDQDTLAIPDGALEPLPSQLIRLPAEPAAPAAPNLWLEIEPLTGSSAGHVVQIAIFTQPAVTIGRALGEGTDWPLRVYPVAENKDLCMRISSQHARLDRIGGDCLAAATLDHEANVGGWTLTDLNSHNGVRIDQERLPAGQSRQLTDNTVLDFAGALQLRARLIRPERPARLTLDGVDFLPADPAALVLTRLTNRPELACALIADRLPIGGTDPRRALTAPLPTGQVCGTLWYLDERFFWQPAELSDLPGPSGAPGRPEELAPVPASGATWVVGGYRFGARPLTLDGFR